MKPQLRNQCISLQQCTIKYSLLSTSGCDRGALNTSRKISKNELGCFLLLSFSLFITLNDRRTVCDCALDECRSLFEESTVQQNDFQGSSAPLRARQYEKLHDSERCVCVDEREDRYECQMHTAGTPARLLQHCCVRASE